MGAEPLRQKQAPAWRSATKQLACLPALTQYKAFPAVSFGASGGPASAAGQFGLSMAALLRLWWRQCVQPQRRLQPLRRPAAAAHAAPGGYWLWPWFLTASAWARAAAISVSIWASAIERSRASAGARSGGAAGRARRELECSRLAGSRRLRGAQAACAGCQLGSPPGAWRGHALQAACMPAPNMRAGAAPSPGSCWRRGSIITSGPSPSG